MRGGAETHEASYYEQTLTSLPAGDSTRSWGTALQTGVLLRVSEITAARAQSLFGTGTLVTLLALCDEGYALKSDETKDACLKFTAGPNRVGQSYLIVGRRHRPEQEALVLGLVDTNDGP